ncbi:MAG: riboflavin synthase [Deltaproteobacteria bacterium]|nr:riboflavin synthase [Deltaproteobacteria bacterium]
MFSGIVEGKGRVHQLRGSKGKGKLEISSPFSSSLKRGDSVAVNGCCLTVAHKKGKKIEADLSLETLRITNLGTLKEGDAVNLERPLRPIDRLGGHLVQGHIDGVGTVLSIQKNGKGATFEIGLPRSLCRYLIPKGSIAIDGVSMTINGLKKDRFSLFIIPHTLKVTTLGERRRGDRVNLEVDMVGKYIEKFVGQR